jgi:5'-3' exonuclease
LFSVTTTTTAVEPTIIGQKMKRANDQRNNIIDMRRARAVLENARIIRKQRHIREIAKQREHQRLALSSAISRESHNQRIIETNANAWIESWRRTRLDIIRDRHHLSGRQNRPITVIDRIRVLEERHRNRCRALRYCDDLNFIPDHANFYQF